MELGLEKDKKTTSPQKRESRQEWLWLGFGLRLLAWLFNFFRALFWGTVSTRPTGHHHLGNVQAMRPVEPAGYGSPSLRS